MFGDIFHGGCLLLLGIHLCRNPDPDLTVLVPIRYMILLMGFFSFYNGLIYNDFAGLTLDLFGSCYVDEVKKCTYTFGIDPAWAG